MIACSEKFLIIHLIAVVKAKLNVMGATSIKGVMDGLCWEFHACRFTILSCENQHHLTKKKHEMKEFVLSIVQSQIDQVKQDLVGFANNKEEQKTD